MNYNEAKLEILELVEKLGTTDSEEVGLITNKTPKNASMLMMKYYRYGLLSRERIRKTFNYTLTEKGRDRIIYLNANQDNML